MGFRIVVSFESDRPDEDAGEFVELREAAAFALALADTIELEAANGGADQQPSWVSVYSGDRREIMVSVVLGGLVS